LVERGGAGVRRAPPIIPGLIRAIRQRGAPAHASRDAGDYVCNQTFYATLGLMPQTLFIHVPRPRRRGPLRGEPSRMATLAQMTRGVEAAIVFATSRFRPSISAAKLTQG
jgi:pyroglutamyl-peptidase